MTSPQVGPEGGRAPVAKSPGAFRTIAEVATDLDLPQHVLRFWESKFPQIRPLKRRGGRRYYRPEDISLLRSIRGLLYDEGYTIKGVQRLLKEGGSKAQPGREEPMRRAAVQKPPKILESSPANLHDRLKHILQDLELTRELLRRSRV